MLQLWRNRSHQQNMPKTNVNDQNNPKTAKASTSENPLNPPPVYVHFNDSVLEDETYKDIGPYSRTFL